MGSLILCHKKHARQPYVIARGHIRIYTLEELCYFICNNLYLIDYTLINRQLCEWIRTELQMYELADALQEELDNHCTEEDFILKILQAVNNVCIFGDYKDTEYSGKAAGSERSGEIQAESGQPDEKRRIRRSRFLFTGRSLMVSGMIR